MCSIAHGFQLAIYTFLCQDNTPWLHTHIHHLHIMLCRDNQATQLETKMALLLLYIVWQLRDRCKVAVDHHICQVSSEHIYGVLSFHNILFHLRIHESVAAACCFIERPAYSDVFPCKGLLNTQLTLQVELDGHSDLATKQLFI